LHAGKKEYIMPQNTHDQFHYKRSEAVGQVWERRKFMFELIQNLDASALLWIQDVVRQEFLNPLVCLYTKLGDSGILWIVLSAVMLCFRPTRKAGFAALVAMLFGLVLNNMIIKELVGRPRPWLDVEGLRYVIFEGDPNSFPSGHTCSSFAAASAWWRLAPKKWIRVTGLVMAVCMGLSRLYIGVHYPTDVITGAVIGVMCGWLAWMVCTRVIWKKSE